ncbi:MAG: zinc ribbon domain-containing protein [Chloroflexi bacterium]|nr:zinc ribbon domain-containing protein [Chloroflexota bacterium]
MSDFIAFILAAAAIAFIAYPLLRRKPASVSSSADDDLQELYSKRNTTYSMLKELEFDFDSGILTDEDYRALEARYKDKAVSILKGIDDKLEATADAEAAIEKHIRDLRRGKKPAAGLDADVERQIRKLRRGGKPAANVSAEGEKPGRGDGPGAGAPGPGGRRGPFCSRCGARCRDDDRFCAQCGTRLD